MSKSRNSECTVTSFDVYSIADKQPTQVKGAQLYVYKREGKNGNITERYMVKGTSNISNKNVSSFISKKTANILINGGCKVVDAEPKPKTGAPRVKRTPQNLKDACEKRCEAAYDKRMEKEEEKKEAKKAKKTAAKPKAAPKKAAKTKKGKAKKGKAKKTKQVEMSIFDEEEEYSGDEE